MREKGDGRGDEKAQGGERKAEGPARRWVRMLVTGTNALVAGALALLGGVCFFEWLDDMTLGKFMVLLIIDAIALMFAWAALTGLG